MGRVKKNFKSPIYLACSNDDLRPVIQLVIFEEGYAVCTDAYILVRQKLELHGFTPEEIALMEGKRIHGRTLKEIMRYDTVTVSDQGFVCTNDYTTALFPWDTEEGRHPDYKKVIPHVQDRQPVVKISFNPAYIETVRKVSIKQRIASILEFNGTSKAALITTADNGLDDELILLMPVMMEP